MPVGSGEGDISPALEELVPQYAIQTRREVISADILEHDHAHTASDVVSNHMRQDDVLEVCHYADGDRLAGMEIGGSCQGP